MAEFYYSTRDYNIVTNAKLAEIHFLSTGQKLTSEEINNPEFMDTIAANFKGLVKRIDNPSYRLLAKNGHIASAVIVYRNSHNVSLAKAKKRVNAYIEGDENHGQKRSVANAKSDNGSV